MNFWPYPVEPRGLGITTTYPAAANTCAFQRYVQLWPQLPCGPPWISISTGYFRSAWKPYGFTTKLCTREPSAASTQNSSSGVSW